MMRNAGRKLCCSHCCGCRRVGVGRRVIAHLCFVILQGLIGIQHGGTTAIGGAVVDHVLLLWCGKVLLGLLLRKWWQGLRLVLLKGRQQWQPSKIRRRRRLLTTTSLMRCVVLHSVVSFMVLILIRSVLLLFVVIVQAQVFNHVFIGIRHHETAHSSGV